GARHSFPTRRSSDLSLPFIFLTAKGEKRDVRSGMNLGADDYLTKPVTATDLLAAIEARMTRARLAAAREFKPDFTSAVPLESLGDRKSTRLNSSHVK